MENKHGRNVVYSRIFFCYGGDVKDISLFKLNEVSNAGVLRKLYCIRYGLSGSSYSYAKDLKFPTSVNQEFTVPAAEIKYTLRISSP